VIGMTVGLCALSLGLLIVARRGQANYRFMQI
jgi:hypothetical protein